MKHRYDWNEIQGFIDQGNGFAASRRTFGITHYTWKRAIIVGLLRVDAGRKPRVDATKRYDWSAIQSFYDGGNSLRDCRARFGFSRASWNKAIERGEIVPRRYEKLPLSMYLLCSKNRYHIKRRLIREGWLQNQCKKCGLSSWNGKPIVVQLDHVNGDGTDNRLENLRMLCPNCHSQTPTFGARNVKLRRSGGQARQIFTSIA